MVPDTAEIRLAHESDRAAVEAIVAEAYGKYVPRIGRKPGPMLDDYGALIGRRQVYVLEGSDHLDAVLVLIEEGRTMLLSNVAVRPSAQGRGLGRRLLDFAERTAREAGCRSIRLYTHVKMVENIAIYARYGYVETGRAEQDGLSRVFMAKAVDGTIEAS